MTANARLNLELEHLNFRMILRELSEHPRFRSYRYALLAALDANCETPDAFMSGGRDYASFARDTDRANAIQLGAKSSRSLSAGAGGKAVDAGTVSEKNALTRVRYVVEEGLGLSTANWTLALEKSTYDFSTPEIAMADLESLMFDRVVILDPDLRDWYATRDASDRYCHRLKAKSLAALRDLPPPSVPAPLVATKAQDPYLPKLIPKCASCHETGVGPRIPFTNPSALAHLLKAKGYRHGNLFEEIRFRLSIDAGRARMPLGENAEDGERTKLEHYLEALLRP